MQAVVGDRLHVHGNAVGQALCFPGPDAVVEHGKAGAASTRKARTASGGNAKGRKK